MSSIRPSHAGLCAIVLALAGCDAPRSSAPASPPPRAEAAAPDGKPNAAAMVGAPDATTEAGMAAFAGRIWRVRQSSAVAPGTTYAFLDDGTLVIDAPQGTPMYGRWSYQDGALLLTEEGIGYPAEILELTRDRLRLRSHNPGEPVEITLTPAPDPPLPPARPPDAR